MKLFGLVLLCLSMLCPTAAFGDATTSLDQAMAAVNGAIASDKHKLADLTLQQKTNDAKVAGLNQRAAQLKADQTSITNDLRQLKSDIDANEAERQRYIASGCPPNGGSVDDSTYNTCEPWIERINAAITDHSNRYSALTARATQYQSDRTTLNNDVLAQFGTKKRLSAQIEDLNAVISALEARRNFTCGGLKVKSSLEALKHSCGNVQFDGAARNLPPCTDEACKYFDRVVLGGG